MKKPSRKPRRHKAPELVAPAPAERRALGWSVGDASFAVRENDAEVLGLLSLPVLALILSLWATQSLKPTIHLPLPTATADTKADPVRPAIQRRPSADTTLSSIAPTTLTKHSPLAVVEPSKAPPLAAGPEVAMLATAPLPEAVPTPVLPIPGPLVHGSAERSTSEACLAPASVSAEPAGDPSAPFGERLAAAAEAQTRVFVLYTDRYRSLPYPAGDVRPLYGVCTDVVIRAYRALGIDLQRLVHESRLGAGDVSIDHRRTETLRRFLARMGESLPVTAFAEDYEPGDIVTYERPQNRHSRSHIAVVSNVRASSGRPMIVHNRGWGPQLEDALFVDAITGHYRYRAPVAAPILAMTPAPAASPKSRPQSVAGMTGAARKAGKATSKEGRSVAGLGR